MLSFFKTASVLIILVSAIQISFASSLVESYPDFVWPGPLTLQAPASIQLSWFEPTMDSELNITVLQRNDSRPYYDLFKTNSNLTVLLKKPQLDYDITIRIQWPNKIGHPLDVNIFSDGKKYQSVVLHIRKDVLSLKFFVRTQSPSGTSGLPAIGGFLSGAVAVLVAVYMLRRRRTF